MGITLANLQSAGTSPVSQDCCQAEQLIIKTQRSQREVTENLVYLYILNMTPYGWASPLPAGLQTSLNNPSLLAICERASPASCGGRGSGARLVPHVPQPLASTSLQGNHKHAMKITTLNDNLLLPVPLLTLRSLQEYLGFSIHFKVIVPSVLFGTAALIFRGKKGKRIAVETHSLVTATAQQYASGEPPSIWVSRSHRQQHSQVPRAPFSSHRVARRNSCGLGWQWQQVGQGGEFHAKQPQLPQLLLIRLLLQTLPQLRCPSLDTLQHLNVSLVVRSPKLNTVFEVRPHQCRVQGHDHFPSPAGHAIFDTSQDAIGFLGHLGTLLAHIQLAVNQHPQVLFRWAALQPLFPKPCYYLNKKEDSNNKVNRREKEPPDVQRMSGDKGRVRNETGAEDNRQ
ncbi:hypothetical protein QYF61_017545 [Mycteria americana]|uniref:Uncharacterized protein n=1 Tax=Mycteria americana TaxID=33587 RepID=A0AAN7NVY9_MYCAM|nr:hypothetical protein QYF61_017545 [Mycteria americana]